MTSLKEIYYNILEFNTKAEPKYIDVSEISDIDRLDKISLVRKENKNTIFNVYFNLVNGLLIKTTSKVSKKTNKITTTNTNVMDNIPEGKYPNKKLGSLIKSLVKKGYSFVNIGNKEVMAEKKDIDNILSFICSAKNTGEDITAYIYKNLDVTKGSFYTLNVDDEKFESFIVFKSDSIVYIDSVYKDDGLKYTYTERFDIAKQIASNMTTNVDFLEHTKITGDPISLAENFPYICIIDSVIYYNQPCSTFLSKVVSLKSNDDSVDIQVNICDNIYTINTDLVSIVSNWEKIPPSSTCTIYKTLNIKGENIYYIHSITST